ARLVVSGEMANDAMTLQVETYCTGPDSLIEKLGLAMREVTKLRGDVELVLPGSLPNDGKVIEDARSYK
ncbi:MAG: phenylacetate--CoA ligase family protein, partial [Betaproteobacteria bacterium]